jgi:G3E family GTPase
MFAAARLMILNKIDLLPHLDFDVQRCLDYARQVNPQIQIIQLSARDGTGLDAWLDWLLAAPRWIDAPRASPNWKPNWPASKVRWRPRMRSEKLPGAPVWPPVLACGAHG